MTPKPLNAEQLEAVKMHREGASIGSIAAELCRNRKTISRWFDQAGIAQVGGGQRRSPLVTANPSARTLTPPLAGLSVHRGDW